MVTLIQLEHFLQLKYSYTIAIQIFASSGSSKIKPVLILLLDDLEFSTPFPAKMIKIAPACLFN